MRKVAIVRESTLKSPTLRPFLCRPIFNKRGRSLQSLSAHPWHLMSQIPTHSFQLIFTDLTKKVQLRLFMCKAYKMARATSNFIPWRHRCWLFCQTLAYFSSNEWIRKWMAKIKRVVAEFPLNIMGWITEINYRKIHETNISFGSGIASLFGSTLKVYWWTIIII